MLGAGCNDVGHGDGSLLGGAVRHVGVCRLPQFAGSGAFAVGEVNRRGCCMCVEAALCPATTVLLLRLAKSISETFAADGADCTVSSADRSVRWVPAGEGSTDQRDATIGARDSGRTYG